jgi:hypothetical protein
MISLPNGALVAIANQYGTSKVMSAVTNANPAAATFATGHAIATGDVLVVTSGWSKLTNRVVVAGTVAGDTVPLTGVNASSTSLFPAGGGAGSAMVVQSWTQLAQILGSASSGGEQQFLEYQLLESDTQQRIPTTKSASGLSFTVADDPALPGYLLASQANDDRLPRAVRITLPSGALIFYNAYISLNKTPTLTVNEIMAIEVTLSLLSEPMRYAAPVV